MINIPVDESYAFDFLSILEIKMQYRQDKTLAEHANWCRSSIAAQVGEDKFAEIMVSDEYDGLKRANQHTFEMVDLAKTDKVSASDVDYSNLLRFNARKRLQDRFFENSNAEVKIGYDAYAGR